MTAAYLAGDRDQDIVPEKLHKLAALRQLREGMSDLEKQHHERVERGDNSAEVDRDIAKLALTDVMAFCLELDIASGPLYPLLAALEALSTGSSLPVMLAPAGTSHRRPDAPAIEGIKGRLAAIMEYRQETGSTRKEAAAWVARNIPPKMKGQLGSAKPTTVDSWLVKWGGEHGTSSEHGREGYLAMRTILRQHRPSVPDLKKIFEVLIPSLPS